MLKYSVIYLFCFFQGWIEPSTEQFEIPFNTAETLRRTGTFGAKGHTEDLTGTVKSCSDYLDKFRTFQEQGKDNRNYEEGKNSLDVVFLVCTGCW